MIDSILSLWVEMNESFNANGDRELCLSDDDNIILTELQKSMKPFSNLTNLVNSGERHLSLIPLIVKEVKDAAGTIEVSESEITRQLTDIILENIDRKLSISDTVKEVALLDPSLRKVMIIDEN